MLSSTITPLCRRNTLQFTPGRNRPRELWPSDRHFRTSLLGSRRRLRGGSSSSNSSSKDNNSDSSNNKKDPLKDGWCIWDALPSAYPEPKVATTSSRLAGYPVSMCAVQGPRPTMEDEMAVTSDFCAIFDGHGGSAVARYLRHNLYATLQKYLGHRLSHQQVGTVQDYVRAFRSAIAKISNEVHQILHWSYQGSTVLALWIHQSLKTRDANVSTDGSPLVESDPVVATPKTTTTLVLANVGDSRAVMSVRGGRAVDLTKDHKPNDPEEYNRILQVGGRLVWDGPTDIWGNRFPNVRGAGYRINGSINLSRAIGDRAQGVAVSAEPDVVAVDLDGHEEFLVLATDGVWDVFSSEEVVAMVHTLWRTCDEPDGRDRDLIPGILAQWAIQAGSNDNVSIVIVWLRQHQDQNQSSRER
jgi:serine/threonine protein phosphatase PrpC